MQYFTRFLGLNTDCIDQLQEEQKYTTYKVVPMENKKVGFELELRGQKHVFSPEQVLAYLLRKIKKFYDHANITTKDVVISVPSYYSNSER